MLEMSVNVIDNISLYIFNETISLHTGVCFKQHVLPMLLTDDS